MRYTYLYLCQSRQHFANIQILVVVDIGTVYYICYMAYVGIAAPLMLDGFMQQHNHS